MEQETVQLSAADVAVIDAGALAGAVPEVAKRPDQVAVNASTRVVSSIGTELAAAEGETIEQLSEEIAPTLAYASLIYPGGVRLSEDHTTITDAALGAPPEAPPPGWPGPLERTLQVSLDADRRVHQIGHGLGEAEGCVIEDVTDEEHAAILAALPVHGFGVTLSRDHVTITPVDPPPGYVDPLAALEAAAQQHAADLALIRDHPALPDDLKAALTRLITG